MVRKVKGTHELNVFTVDRGQFHLQSDIRCHLVQEGLHSQPCIVTEVVPRKPSVSWVKVLALALLLQLLNHGPNRVLNEGAELLTTLTNSAEAELTGHRCIVEHVDHTGGQEVFSEGGLTRRGGVLEGEHWGDLIVSLAETFHGEPKGHAVQVVNEVHAEGGRGSVKRIKRPRDIRGRLLDRG